MKELVYRSRAEYHKEYREIKKAKGLCYECKNKVKENRSRCDKHLKERAAKKAKKDESNRNRTQSETGERLAS
jgi:hypothetical protein